MKNRIEGFDYNRAVMSVFVVIWHMYSAKQYLIYANESNPNTSPSIFYFLNVNILLLAVPCFIFMSNYLYALTSMDRNTLLKRLERIGILLIFWAFMMTIWQYGYDGILSLWPTSLSSFLNNMLTAGHTIYYFFVSLMITLLATYIISKFNTTIQMAGLSLSLAILASLPILAKTFNIYALSAFWNPLNFIPFSFAAVLMAKNGDFLILHKKKIIFTAIVFYVLFAFFEWQCAIKGIFSFTQDYAISLYSRASLFWGVIAISAITLNQNIKAPAIIKFMSKYSLALYCIHLFLTNPISRLMGSISRNQILTEFASLFFVVLCSYFLAYILKKYFLKSELLM